MQYNSALEAELMLFVNTLEINVQNTKYTNKYQQKALLE